MKDNTKDNWDKAKIVIGILIPVVIAFVGYTINKTISEKELKIKYVEIAVDVLKASPTKESCELRYWAIDILKEYSPIVLSDESAEMLKYHSMPSGMYLEPGIIEPGYVENKC